MNRRIWIKTAAVLAGLVVSAPLRALAAAWNKAAFEAGSTQEALRGLGAANIGPSRDIVLMAPDLAENGAIVQIEVESRLPDTQSIAILAEKNPTPLIAEFTFAAGALPYVVTRVKIAETAEISVLVKASGRYYRAAKKVEVAVGGCG